MVCDAGPPLLSSVVPGGTMCDVEGSLAVDGNHDSGVCYPWLVRGTKGSIENTTAFMPPPKWDLFGASTLNIK